MPAEPLIAVAGGTSKQGRSVVRTLIDDGRFRVRALTRDPSSSQAQNLARLGAEVVSAPLALGHDEEWLAAFVGADGAFLMTPPIAPEGSREYELGCRLADAAVRAGDASCSAPSKTSTRSQAGNGSPLTSPIRPGSLTTSARCP